MSAARRPVERVRGTQDAWPREAQQLDALRRQLEATYRSFGYQRIDVPVLEPAELHLRKSGLDIISKLYAFTDQGGRRLCLRPELTASVVRAYVAQPAPRLPVKVFSSGPVFRYERPSKGRYRQFTQSGVELVGAAGPLADAEVVFLAMHALDSLGLVDYRVTIGHVGLLGRLLAKLGLTGRLRTFLLESVEEARRRGTDAVRARLRELDPDLFEADQPGAAPSAGQPASGAAEPVDERQVRAAVAGLLAELGAEALGRRSQTEVVERMVRKLRPRVSQEAVARALGFVDRLGALRGAPAEALRAGRDLLAAYDLEDEPLRELEETVGLLEQFGGDLRRVTLDLGLSRGLQYYTGTVFEIDHTGLGSESQLCGGGRYDDLIRALGARHGVPALGFAFGVERVRLALDAEGKPPEPEPGADVFVAPAAPEQGGYAARVAQALRAAGLRAHLEVCRRPLRASLAHAGREGYAYVAVVGDAEARAGTVRVREMAGGGERTLPLGDLGRLRREQPGRADVAGIGGG